MIYIHDLHSWSIRCPARCRICCYMQSPHPEDGESHPVSWLTVLAPGANIPWLALRVHHRGSSGPRRDRPERLPCSTHVRGGPDRHRHRPSHRRQPQVGRSHVQSRFRARRSGATFQRRPQRYERARQGQRRGRRVRRYRPIVASKCTIEGRRRTSAFRWCIVPFAEAADAAEFTAKPMPSPAQIPGRAAPAGLSAIVVMRI
jgi:hypothetical protein